MLLLCQQATSKAPAYSSRALDTRQFGDCVKLVFHNYLLISAECFLEQLDIIQNHALNILGLHYVPAREEDDLESAGWFLESPQKYSDVI